MCSTFRPEERRGEEEELVQESIQRNKVANQWSTKRFEVERSAAYSSESSKKTKENGSDVLDSKESEKDPY